MQSNKEFVQHLMKNGGLKTEKVINAFREVDRKYFVPEQFRDSAYVDTPLPIGPDQTISQPYTVAIMLELLSVEVGNRILDIGFGSGWTTALLANIVGPNGKVYSLERVADVYKFGKENLEKLKLKNVKLYLTSGWTGLARHAPFDRILVSASAPELPQQLIAQLAPKGRMVVPVVNDLILITVDPNTARGYTLTRFPGFVFVPFVPS